MPALAAPPQVVTVVRADRISGRLVRSLRVQSNDPPPDSQELIGMIDSIAAQHGVEDSLVHSVIRAESNYNPRAVSPKGALGIMQLIPSTAKRFGVANPFDARENVEGGVKYLKFLLDYYQDNYAKAIAAYNAGENAVDKFNGIPPYPETQNYVYRVAGNLKAARGRRKLPAPAVQESTPPEHQAIRASVGSDGKVYYRTE